MITRRVWLPGVGTYSVERYGAAADPSKGRVIFEEELEADVVVLATGFERPSVDFLPQDLFPEEYNRPNLYLQNFSTEDWSVLMTNSSYVNAIGACIP